MDKFKFEKLIIWQKAMDFGEVIDKLSLEFPDREKFNLSSQICRASDSIALNISEGSIGQSNLEQKKFIGYSIRSLAEVVTCLFKAKRKNYITEKQFTYLYDESYHLMNMMSAFRKNIN
ncbi:four helix bundle protein [Tamlana agarivorans]|uniref:Four helix bundle protein n=1 Tax=Pseudotamlana agarivorans TaxID=481183 RepID=A0ACC5U9R1_9FLAO|nr:four helix bundle protein [Tamlana agarivorans]MBU2951051.1 four helix bundle protein [Tamlana agarivorans]